jgi:broad specificity phosphatase PhoE
MLFLVRHGRPLPVPGVTPDQWELDPAGYDDIWALRESGRLPRGGAWFSSPEPKAVATAQLLTEAEVGLIDALREHVRDSTAWLEDFEGTVQRAFAQPDAPAHDGWEPLARCRERTARAVRGILSAHPDEGVVLVGHGTAWTLLASELTGEPPDLDRWAGLQMPDVIVLDLPEAR